MLNDYDAVIVGGGIAGLALGCALANNGKRACILEARSKIIPSKRGLTLQPNGLAALQRLGLVDRVLQIGTKTTRVTWYNINNGSLATLDYSILDHPYNCLLTVVPSDLERVLRDEFLAESGTIYESTTFQERTIEHAGSRVVRVLENEVPTELSTRILVGADGENSTVRKALGIPTHVKDYSDHYLFMLVGPVYALQEEARQYLDRRKMVGFYPTPDSTYVFYYLPKGQFDSLKARGLASFKEELASIEPDISNALDNLQSWNDVAYAAPKRVDADSWVADGAALIGDAAHALDPAWAQGANIALQDAVALADTTQRCFEMNDFSANALKAYEKARRNRSSSYKIKPRERPSSQRQRTGSILGLADEFSRRRGRIATS